MSEKIKKRAAWGIVFICITALVILDISHFSKLESPRRASIDLSAYAGPVENSLVAIATSSDPELGDLAAPIDAILTYEQVDAIVRRAIELDTSSRSLLNVIEDGDWVVIKPNIVTSRGLPTAYYYGGVEHKGQNTDLRVVKSVINYLIEHKNLRRITIAEGSAEWGKLGEPGTPSNQTVDGWTVHWPEYGNLSYEDIVNEFNATHPGLVDIVDLSYDSYRYVPVPDPMGSGIFGLQREAYYMPSTVLDCDKWIDIAAMKTHCIPGVTLVHKLRIGTLANQAYESSPNSGYGEMHKFETSETKKYGINWVEEGFIDLFSYHPSDYAFIEGFWGTEGNGPQWGDDIKRNIVICGADPVAVDAVGASVMGFNPWDMDFLHLSAAKGFGTFDMDKITVVGRSIEEVKYDFAKPRKYTAAGFYIGRGNRTWLINGPYHTTDMEADSLGGESTILPGEGEVNGGKTWKKHDSYENYIDLRDYFSGQSVDNVITYAFVYIVSSREQSGNLWVGSDDGIRIWLNGELVLDHPSSGSYSIAEDKVPITLKAGVNTLLVKVKNSYGYYGFSVNVCDDDGDTLPGIEYTVDKSVLSVARAEHPSPGYFSLFQNYPNPFNAETVIRYRIERAGRVKLEVFNNLGQRVRTLFHGQREPGEYRVFWDGKDDSGHPVPSGLYLCRLINRDHVRTTKMLLLR